MAEAYHVAMAPHNYNSTTIGLAATLHASVGMPNFLITEYFVNFEEVGKEIAHQFFTVEDGFINLPDEARSRNRSGRAGVAAAALSSAPAARSANRIQLRLCRGLTQGKAPDERVPHIFSSISNFFRNSTGSRLRLSVA